MTSEERISVLEERIRQLEQELHVAHIVLRAHDNVLLEKGVCTPKEMNRYSIQERRSHTSERKKGWRPHCFCEWCGHRLEELDDFSFRCTNSSCQGEQTKSPVVDF